MAHNSQDIVGEITLKEMTPVIRAVFNCYNLSMNPQSPGVYAFCTGESFSHFGIDGNGTWGEFIEDLVDLAVELKVSDGDYAAGDYGYGLIVKLLLTHFGQGNHPAAHELIQIAQGASEYDNIEMWYLFDLAKLLDDGHGLHAYQLGSAWYCSKPRPGEFGGYSEFQNQNVKMYRTSAMVDQHAPAVSTLLDEKSYEQVGAMYAREADALIGGIIDPYAQHQVACHVIKNLNDHYSSMFVEQPASNDPTTAQSYETTAVRMTTDEAHAEIAHSMYHIARKWADMPATIDNYTLITGALGEFTQLLQEGNGATIPPMQLYPINPTDQIYDPTVYRNNEMEKGRWNFNQPLPLVDPVSNVSLSQSFEDISRGLEMNRINAAKKMFGS
jgi:hypothetical protein